MVDTPVSTANVTVVHRIATVGRTAELRPERAEPRRAPGFRGPAGGRGAGPRPGERQLFFFVLQLRFMAGDFVTDLPL